MRDFEAIGKQAPNTANALRKPFRRRAGQCSANDAADFDQNIAGCALRRAPDVLSHGLAGLWLGGLPVQVIVQACFKEVLPAALANVETCYFWRQPAMGQCDGAAGFGGGYRPQQLRSGPFGGVRDVLYDHVCIGAGPAKGQICVAIILFKPGMTGVETNGEAVGMTLHARGPPLFEIAVYCLRRRLGRRSGGDCCGVIHQFASWMSLRIRKR